MRLPRHIRPYGPRGLLLEWEQRMDPGISRGVHAYAAELSRIAGVTECVPGYASVLVTFDPQVHTLAALREQLYDLKPAEEPWESSICHRVPVVYGGDFGPDLAAVARHVGSTPEEITERHQAVEYLVYLLGFRPGFAFMGQTDAGLTVERRGTPRTSVPGGSVGLAGRQTGIYPQASPGGWQLIGRTPWRLVGPDGTPLFRAGDRVRFYAIPEVEFADLKSPAPCPRH